MSTQSSDHAQDGLRTDRLLLRRWLPADAGPMADINGDPEVVRHLNRPVDDAAIRGFYRLVTGHWREHGFGFFAAERIARGEFVGFVGVAYPTFIPELVTRPELGWRLKRSAWGTGLATEGARAVIDFSRVELGLGEVIAVIHPDNARSRRVAEKLGLRVEGEVFNPVLDRTVDVWQTTLSAIS